MDFRITEDLQRARIWIKEMTWVDKDEERKFIEWLGKIEETYNEENSLTITEDWLNCKREKQIIMHFINPDLATFPRGFAVDVAESHTDFNLEEMKQLKISRSDCSEVIIYYSENKYGCQFIHVRSTKENFKQDLRTVLVYYQGVKLEKKIEINIPCIGMGLWRCNPDQVLEEFEEYNKEDNNLIFKMFVPDKRIMKNLTSSDKGTVSTFYPPRKLDTNIILHEQEQQKLILQIQDSDSEDENKTMSSDSNADMEISHATDTLEEDQYQIFSEQRKVKNKSPSQKKRDRNRLIEFRRRIRENKNEDGLNVTNKKEIGVQTEKKKTWRRRWLQLFTPSDRTGNECVEFAEGIKEDLNARGKNMNEEILAEPSVDIVDNSEENPKKEEKEETISRKQESKRRESLEKPSMTQNWNYGIQEKAYKLSILEDPQILVVALRHLVRNLQDEGERITFPIPNAVDRITLKRNNIPTDPGELLLLVDEVFERRAEYLDLNEVHRDFVKAHGRAVLDLRESWPRCYAHTRHPR